jgi:hypothetical protein
VQVATRDRPLLERLIKRLGVGSIQERRAPRPNWQATSVLTINSLHAHRTAVIPYMGRHLLQSAKRQRAPTHVHVRCRPRRGGLADV